MFKKVKKRNNQKVELDHTTDDTVTAPVSDPLPVTDVEMAQPP